MKWTEIVIALVALYGAIISTCNLLASRAEKIRKVRVALSMGFTACGARTSPTQLMLEAQNVGKRAITLTAVGLVLPRNVRVWFLHPECWLTGSLPHELHEGKNFVSARDLSELVAELAERGYSGRVRVQGIYTDALGTDHRSKPLTLNVEKCLGSAQDVPR